MTQPIQEQRSRLYIRLLLRIVLFAAVILFLIYALPPLFSLFAPFIAAFIVALILNPLVNLINRKLGLPRRLVSMILVVLVFAGLAALISWGVYIVVGEAVSLAKNYQSIWAYVNSAIDYLYVQFAWLVDFFPSIKDFNLMDNIYSWLQNASTDFLNSLYGSMTTITSSVSNAVVGVIIFVMAAYFITAEYRVIGNLLEKYFGDRIYGHIRMLKNTTQTALWQYLKAQLLLALLAFVVMLTALLIYGQPYAFLIALFLAFVDLLPIIGTAAVLVPWGIIELVSGDIVKGLFLFILSGGFFVLRKIVEPKILGSQTGLHPLVALISIYVGFKVGGVLGAILGPVLFMVAISIYKTAIFDKTLKDVRDVFKDITGFMRRKDHKRNLAVMAADDSAEDDSAADDSAADDSAADDNVDENR